MNKHFNSNINNNANLIEGYYRVTYDETNYDLIEQQLLDSHENISTKNRAQLMDDSLNLARANMLPYERALNMTLYLQSERDYLPWRAAATALTYLDTILYDSKAYNDWKVSQFLVLI